MQIKYVGPFDEVEVDVDPDPEYEAWKTVKRGDPLTVPDEVADALLRQRDNWQQVKKPAPK